MLLGFAALGLVAARTLAVGGSEALEYDLDPGLTCPSADQVRAAFEHDMGDFQTLPGPDWPPGRRLRIERGPDNTLLVRLWEPGDRTSTTRQIRGGSCAARAEAIALLALSWRAQPSSRADQALLPNRSPAPGQHPVAPIADGEPNRPRFEPRLGGGIFVPSAPALVGGKVEGALDLHLDDRWGVSVHADWLTPLHAEDPDSAGSLSVDRFTLGVDATWQGWPLPRVMSLMLGLQDEIDQADPAGYLVENRATTQTLQLRVAALYRWFIAGALFAYAEGSGTVGLWQHRFEAHDLDQEALLLTLPAVQISLSGGLGLRFF